MMRGLEESVGETAKVLLAMPREELVRLEESVRQLTPEQVDFVRRTLESALLDGRLPNHGLQLLEYCFECWWEHGLATKLVVIGRIIELSNGGVWPGDIPVSDALTNTCNDDGAAIDSANENGGTIPCCVED